MNPLQDQAPSNVFIEGELSEEDLMKMTKAASSVFIEGELLEEDLRKFVGGVTETVKVSLYHHANK